MSFRISTLWPYAISIFLGIIGTLFIILFYKTGFYHHKFFFSILVFPIVMFINLMIIHRKSGTSSFTQSFIYSIIVYFTIAIGTLIYLNSIGEVLNIQRVPFQIWGKNILTAVLASAAVAAVFIFFSRRVKKT